MNKQKKRFEEIDLLKGFAALLVILIHVTAHYRGDSDFMYFFWDKIHFSVGVFVLVSGFLQAHSTVEFNTARDIWEFLVKKFKRIVIPYYIFAFLFVVATVLIGSKSLDSYLSFSNLQDTVLLWGGIGNNWIPRLFMSLTAVIILETLLSKKLKWVKPLLFTISISGSLYLVTRDLNWMSKFNNLPGWLAIFYVGQYIYHNHSVKTLLQIIGVFSVITFVLHYLMILMGMDTTIFQDKWPPSLYFVSYNLTLTAFVWIIAMYVSPFLSKSDKIMKVVKFLSLSSYEIFFYHLIVIQVWKVNINWFVDWIIIILLTSIVVWGVQWSTKAITAKLEQKDKVKK